MKLTTEIRFRDKITGELHEVGDIFEADEARAKELLSDKRKLVSKVKEEPADQGEKKTAAKAKSKKSTK